MLAVSAKILVWFMIAFVWFVIAFALQAPLIVFWGQPVVGWQRMFTDIAGFAIPLAWMALGVAIVVRRLRRPREVTENPQA